VFNKTFQVFFQLRCLSSDKIHYLAANLQKIYSLGLKQRFTEGIVHFSGYLNSMAENVSTRVKLLRHIRESDIVDPYPNL